MTNYQKGATFERELLHFFHEKGFAVMRNAGSGVGGLGPDLVVVAERVGMAFECKAWKGTSLSIDFEQYRHLAEWLQRSGQLVWIAWKVPKQGIYFIMLSEMRRTEKAWVITLNEVQAIGRRSDTVLALFASTAISRVPIYTQTTTEPAFQPVDAQKGPYFDPLSNWHVFSYS